MSGGPARRVATVAVLVDDYDRALAWYRDKLGFTVEADADLGGGKRWVVVAAQGGAGARLLLARADGAGAVSLPWTRADIDAQADE